MSISLTPHELRVRTQLDALRASIGSNSREADPVRFVHEHANPADQEIVGLLAALLAFGGVQVVMRNVEDALRRIGSPPAKMLQECKAQDLERRFRGFRHRVYQGHHLARMLHRAGRIQRRHGSLGDWFSICLRARSGLRARGSLQPSGFREALAEFADSLRGSEPTRGLRHLVSDPRKGSACKRLLLYLRWMVRPADGVDLGLWPVSPSLLLIPVDTHVHRISRNLGLTQRADASWKTAEEITSALRRFDPDDPVKYDFALCHLGISRDCPSRRDPLSCQRCVLKTVCHQWSDAV